MSNLFKPVSASQLARLSQQPVAMPIQPPQTAAPVVPLALPQSTVQIPTAPTVKSSSTGVRRPQPQLAALSSQLEVLPVPQQIPVVRRQDLERDRDSGHYSWTSQQQLATPPVRSSMQPDGPGVQQVALSSRPTSEQQGRHLVKQQSLGGPAKYMQFMASEPITPTLPPPPFSPVQKSPLPAPVVNYTVQNQLPGSKQSYNSLQSASSSLAQPPTSVFTFQSQQTSTVAMSHQHSSSMSPSNSSARPMAPPSYDEAAAAAASAHNLRRLHLQLQQNLREQQHRNNYLLNSSSVHSLTSPPTMSRHRSPTASSVPGMALEKDDEDEQVSAV